MLELPLGLTSAYSWLDQLATQTVLKYYRANGCPLSGQVSSGEAQKSSNCSVSIPALSNTEPIATCGY